MKENKSVKYREFLKEFQEGKYGDKSLRQACIENKLPYQHVLNLKWWLDE